MFIASREPPVEAYPYAGWIPTANGHLSFRHIGETRHPTESIYANVTTNNRRYLLCFQRRRLSDALFQPLIHYICNIDGKFWFAIAGTSEGTPGNTDDMSGTVFVFKSKPDWGTADEIVRKSISNLNGFRLSLAQDRDAQLTASFEVATAKLKASADITIQFVLNRSGEIFFTKPLFEDSDLEAASASYAQAGGHDLSLWVAQQTYFFVRDISHSHQHHVPTSDTILILQTRRQGDRISWRRDIIYSLQHYIIRSKRFADGKSLTQSAGVLGYCMSFRSICKRNLGEEAENLPVYNDEALLQSLNARAQQEAIGLADWQGKTSIAVARAGNNRAYALVIISLLITVLAILLQPRVTTNGSPALDRFSNFAVENLVPISWIIAVTLFAIFLLTRVPINPTRGITRDLLELANVHRRASVVVMTVVAGLLALLTILFAGDAIGDIRDALEMLFSSLKRWAA